ncbi:hypothetical protein N0V90_007563 [Kalmusia sp. IMI 367209]|nr:hypothetical protein N0V90_007563 [Kalmusia sp. IMI 367209]
MLPLFRPADTDPLAARACISPYIDNICRFLSQSDAEFYCDLMKSFEEDNVTEAALNDYIVCSGLFKHLSDVLYLHDDLVLVITLNNVDTDNQIAKHAEQVAGQVVETKGGKMNAQCERQMEHLEGEKGENSNSHDTSTKEQKTNKDTQASGDPMKAVPKTAAKRVRKPVGKYEKAMLMQEAAWFTSKEKRDTRSANAEKSRRKSVVNYNEKLD